MSFYSGHSSYWIHVTDLPASTEQLFIGSVGMSFGLNTRLTAEIYPFGMVGTGGATRVPPAHRNMEFWKISPGDGYFDGVAAESWDPNDCWTRLTAPFGATGPILNNRHGGYALVGEDNRYGFYLMGWDKGYTVSTGSDAEATFFDDVWRYDREAHHWAEFTSFPGGGRRGIIGFIAHNVLYVGFGSGSSGSDTGGTAIADMWAYDLDRGASGFWEQVYNPTAGTGVGSDGSPGGITDGIAFVLQGRGFVTQGDSLWEWVPVSPSAGTWRAVDAGTIFDSSNPSIEMGLRVDAVAFQLEGRQYVGLGRSLADNSVLHDIWQFDVATESWHYEPDWDFVTGWTEGAVVVVGNYAYLVGGQMVDKRDGTNYTAGDREVWQFDPLLGGGTTTPFD